VHFRNKKENHPDGWFLFYRNSEIAETVLLFPFRPSGLPATLLQDKASALRFTSFTMSVIELTTSSFVLNLIMQTKIKGHQMVTFYFYRNSEIRQKFHFVSTFALRVTPYGVISKSRIIRYAHGVI